MEAKLVVSFKGAYDRLSAAKRNLKDLDYAGAIREAQVCVELSIKALLDFLNIQYKKEHDVGDEAFLKAFQETAPHLKNHEVVNFVRCLAKARVYMRMLSSIRAFTEFGFLDVPAKDLFDSETAKNIVDHAQATYWCLSDLEDRLTL